MKLHLDAAAHGLPSDEWLMTRYYAGEDGALGEVDLRHRKRLEIHVFDRLPLYLASRWELAQDLVGDTFEKVVRTRWRLQARWNPSKGVVRIWLRGILKNQLMSFLRVRKGKETLGVDRRLTDEEGREVSFEEQVAEHRPGAEANALADEQIRELFRAIDALPGDLRTIVWRKFFEHRSHEQIGKEFGVSVPTVSRRLSEAKVCLRSVLDTERADRDRPAAVRHLSL